MFFTVNPISMTYIDLISRQLYYHLIFYIIYAVIDIIDILYSLYCVVVQALQLVIKLATHAPSYYYIELFKVNILVRPCCY